MITPPTTPDGAPRPDGGAVGGAQERLRALLRQRIEAARSGLARRHDLAGPAGLRAAQEEIVQGGHDVRPVSVVAVVSRFDLATWVSGICLFAASLDPEPAASWRQSFTRTLFLAGDPAKLRERFTFDQVSADATMAWSGPAPDGATTGLRRLLRAYDGMRPFDGPRCTVRVPAPGGRSGSDANSEPYSLPALTGSSRPAGVDRWSKWWRVELTTVGVTVADALIHLNHLLAEAVMDGLIAPGDELAVRPVPRLVEPWESYATVRISADSRDPDRLRAYAGLTERTPEGGYLAQKVAGADLAPKLPMSWPAEHASTALKTSM